MSDFNIHDWQAKNLRPSLDEQDDGRDRLRRRTIKSGLKYLVNLVDYAEDVNNFIDLAVSRLEAMRPSEEMSESAEGDDRMEGLVNIKAYNAFIKASGMLVKDLENEGFDEEEIYDFLLRRIKTQKYILEEGENS